MSLPASKPLPLAVALEKMGVTIKSKQTDAPVSSWSKSDREALARNYYFWRCTILRASKAVITPYRYARFQEQYGPEEPPVHDVIGCLLTDAKAFTFSFVDFCQKFDLRTTERRSFESWLWCYKVKHKLERFFSPDEIQELYDSQQRGKRR